MKNTLLLALALLAIPTLANSQTISDKKFTKTNSLVFEASGFVNFSAAMQNQASSFENKKLPDGFNRNYSHEKGSVGNDSQVFLKTGLMDKNGVKYGAVAKFEVNVNSNGRKENPNLDQNFIFAESDFGNFEFGNNFAVNQKMKVGAARLAKGAGGINGKYLEHVNLSMLTDSSQNSAPVCSGSVGSTACQNVKLPSFILLAQSPIGHGGGAKSFYRRDSTGFGSNEFNRINFRALKDNSFDGFEDATKINYYSPRISGLQFGASYTPSSANNGLTANTSRDIESIRIKNIFSFGVNYSQDFDNLAAAFSATAEKGKVKNSKSAANDQRNDLMAYDIGASLSYFGFTLGASYGSWQKSLQQKNGIYSCDYNASQSLALQNCSNDAQKFSNPHYFSAGISYEIGPIGASITSIKSEFQKNEYQAISLGLDYKLTRDLMPYFEVTKYAFTSNQVQASDVANQGGMPSSQRHLKDNQGYVFLTGILLSF